MFVTGQCKKCGGRPIFDIGDLSREQVENWMDKTDFGHCSVGWHVELGKMSDYYVLDWSKTFKTKSEAEEYNKQKEQERIAV
jgi:hypothetical protein